MTRPVVFDIKLGGKGYNIDRSTYKEQGPSQRPLERQIYQSATGELDFEPSWPYHQRSFILGEKQYHTHEFDEMKTTAVRRYQEGHGIDPSREGELGLLPALSLSKNTTNNPATCPMIVSPSGASVYAFPAGETKMYKFTSGSWDAGETITDVTAPVTDAYMAGTGEIYIIDSKASGVRVMKRTTAGAWSRLSVTAATSNDGNTEVFTNAQALAVDYRRQTWITVEHTGTVTTARFYLDGSGSGTGDQVVKAYLGLRDSPYTILGTSAAVTVVDGQGGGWVEFTWASAMSVTAGTEYVLGLLTGDATNTIQWYYGASTTFDSRYAADEYDDGPAGVTGTGEKRNYSAYVVVSYNEGGFGSSDYNDATAVVWINGEVYVVTPDEVYCHSLEEIVSEFCGGSIACAHDGALYWTDGSNRVYEYNGIGTREVIGQLPPGFAIQSLFSAHSRMWICGQLQNGDAAAYWFGQGQYGILDYFPAAAGSTRSIKGGAATDEYVLFADSRYGGSLRHYVPEGGWSHYLALGSAQTIPYKGIVTGAGKLFVALATGVAGTQGIYGQATTYVTSGTLTSSQMDLQMPAHKKRWVNFTMTTLPLRAGEKILLEVSDDGGRTFYTVGYMEDLNQSTASFPIDYESPTLQYRLTLYSGTSAATDPRILSVTVRGLPIIPSSRMWAFRIRGVVAAPGIAGKVVMDEDARTKALLDEVNDSKTLDFEDLYGDTYTVTAKYLRTPAYDAGGFRVGSFVDVELQEMTS